MYAVDFTQFEKHSRFSLRPAEQATHDNQLCFAKTGNAFARLRCSTQSITASSSLLLKQNACQSWSRVLCKLTFFVSPDQSDMHQGEV